MGARDYGAALEALSSLITKRSRGDGTNRGDSFDLMPRYLQVAGLDEPLSKLSIIHVAGTKGKGSTCTFSESILGECGYKTGLFTSPHLIDVRERFKVNRANVSEHVFLKHFWWCWDQFKMNVGIDMPMPTYFRFLTLLAFKIFIEEKVDVAILEVGLGGRFDATNVVRTPTVCGITSLGYDHMEILGYTLPEIAGEKAGIFKQGIPAFTVAQQKEAMDVLQKKASELDIRLQVVSPLTEQLLNGSQLSMEGEHQLSNGALAVALCHCWAHRRNEKKHLAMFDDAMSKGYLPEPYIKGLISAQLLGRAQQIQDQAVKGLSFFLDGAHSPESMEVCGRWFCVAVHKANCTSERELHATDMSNEQLDAHAANKGGSSIFKIHKTDGTSKRVLLFNCMPQRDPTVLLPRLINTCDNHGFPFHHAMFVPGLSSYTQVTVDLPSATKDGSSENEDLSWENSIQKVYDSLPQSQSGAEKQNKTSELFGGVRSCVVPSLPAALDLLRQYCHDHSSHKLQVLVTGSLHLVGDVLRMLKK
ncbi:hypothetical protein GOP47_0014833 [Adiantum capillus-veneris]|uniref:Folylpolyglutamate synthase n=1 Tax=Adiantum capillus-veneris TaxID=13818 RepID=A0A9D4UMH5_ADICA|nr:hypothetical protein GOP47_0014833 [Adiantum capillus-veneris]